MSKKKLVFLNPQNPCPCFAENKKKLKDCCLLENGRIYKKRPKLIPKVPKTKYSNEKCYLSYTNDCSEKISAEHILSKIILEYLEEIEITGAPWLEQGERRKIGVNSYTSKILCQRHNSCLSPLDHEAGNLFKTIHGIYASLLKKSISKRKKAYIVSGETIEGWMIKLLCNIYYSGNVTLGGEKLNKYYTIHVPFMSNALFGGLWYTKDCGLYVKASAKPGNLSEYKFEIRWRLMINEDAARIVGIKVTILGIEFILLLDPLGFNKEQLEKKDFRHHPDELVFTNQKQTHLIKFTWPHQTNSKSIKIKFLSKYEKLKISS